jgi:hypothetical protein
MTHAKSMLIKVLFRRRLPDYVEGDRKLLQIYSASTLLKKLEMIPEQNPSYRLA